MFAQLRKLSNVCNLRPSTNLTRFLSQAASKPINPSIVEKNVAQNTKNVVDEGKVILLTKKHVSQSPLKMKFLVRLVRGAWIPDAVAQMKFSPKHRAEDIGRMLNVRIFD